MAGLTLGFVGLGAMGAHMCRNLAKKSGLPVMAHDANPEAMRKIQGDNITPVRRMSTLAQSSNIVFLCLPSASEVRDVAAELIMQTRAGWIVVDMSTTSVELTQKLAENFAEQKSAFVDAPISRGPDAAKDGNLSFMVGGPKPVYDTLEPILRYMGSEVSHCGDTGMGQTVNILSNMVMFQNVVAVGEALAVGRRLGVDGEMLLDTLAKGSADSFALRKHGKKNMLTGNYPQGAFPLNYARGDLDLAIGLAEQTDIDIQGTRNVKRLFDAASKKGFGDVFFPIIQKLIEPRKK